MVIDSASLTSNPFAVLTAVAGPAVLTNASSVLALGTSNRLARVVDRTRVVAAELAALDPAGAEHAGWTRQLRTLQVRTQLLLRALQVVYASLGAFATAALLSVIGSVAAFYGEQHAFQALAVIALGTGTFAVIALALGCSFMVRETRLAVQGLADEAASRSHQRTTPQQP